MGLNGKFNRNSLASTSKPNGIGINWNQSHALVNRHTLKVGWLIISIQIQFMLFGIFRLSFNTGIDTFSSLFWLEFSLHLHLHCVALLPFNAVSIQLKTHPMWETNLLSSYFEYAFNFAVYRYSNLEICFGTHIFTHWTGYICIQLKNDRVVLVTTRAEISC